MQKLAGILEFSGSWLNRPWALIQQDGSTIDLYPLIDEMLLKMNGKSAEHDQGRESYGLMLNDSAEMVVKYESDGVAVLEKPGGFGMSNIGAYLPSALTWLSGRKVEIEFNDNGFKIAADPSEQVFGVKFFGRGNSCRIPEGVEDSICKVGTSDCCIFAAAGSDGFTCEKFSGSTAEMLLNRHFKGTMRASRVGNCALVGREEDDTPKDPMTPSMDLDTKPGEKVLFDKPNSGYEHDSATARKHLNIGDTYTVERVEVADWSSEVFLKEVPDVGFNTTHFQNVHEAAASTT
ncbi:MAG: hypothetical protein HYY55_03210 [Candidatus Niyogibacteria bacterium]|nr:MAG: hypothetical protein HYY55_03210 [Candidatus Niyogibacteria bacterium]